MHDTESQHTTCVIACFIHVHQTNQASLHLQHLHFISAEISLHFSLQS